MNTDNLFIVLIIIALLFYTNYFFNHNIENNNIKNNNIKNNNEHFVPYTHKLTDNYCDENYYNIVEKINNNLDHYKNKKISDIYDDLTF